MKITNFKNRLEFFFGTEERADAVFAFFKTEIGMNQCIDFVQGLQGEVDPEGKDIELLRTVEHACNEFLAGLKPLH